MIILTNSDTSYVFRPEFWILDGLNADYVQRVDTQPTVESFSIQLNGEDATRARLTARFLPTSWARTSLQLRNTLDGSLETRQRNWFVELDILRRMLRKKELIEIGVLENFIPFKGYARQLRMDLTDAIALQDEGNVPLTVSIAIDFVIEDEEPVLPSERLPGTLLGGDGDGTAGIIAETGIINP